MTDDALLSAVVILASYLWGGIPTSYLVARRKLGIDIRSYGSGNIGATNLMAQAGTWTGFFTGLYDCVGKGTLPVLIAGSSVLDLGHGVQGMAGLAAVAGHNWSPYMRFSGGRGVATGVGVLLGFFVWREMLIMTFVLGFLGRLVFKETGFWTLISLIILPPLSYALDQPIEIVLTTLGLTVLLVAKRVMANESTTPDGIPLRSVVLNRILWDRDVPVKSDWLDRSPPPEGREATSDA